MRDQDEQDEARSERLTLDAVARINDALASGRALAEVLQVICSEACRAFGVRTPSSGYSITPPSPPEFLPHARRESVRKTGEQHTNQAVPVADAQRSRSAPAVTEDSEQTA
jgi:hypothetical protein